MGDGGTQGTQDSCAKMGDGEGRCVYASAAVASRRSVVVYCAQPQLLCYAAASRILAYCPQSCRVVGLSQDRSVGPIVGLRSVAGPQSSGVLTLLSLHATGAVAVWQMPPQVSHTTHRDSVSNILQRKFHIPDQHKGSISSGDACFIGPSSCPCLMVVTGGTDHVLRVLLLCLESGSVLWNETIKLRDRALVLEVRVVPLVAPSSTDTAPLPLILCGGDDAKVQVFAAGPAEGEQSTSGPQYHLVGTLPGHTDWITALDFVYLEDTLMVASGSKDGGVRVWRFQFNSKFIFPSTHDSSSSSEAGRLPHSNTASSEINEPETTPCMKQLNDVDVTHALDDSRQVSQEMSNSAEESGKENGNKSDVLRVRPVCLGVVGNAVLETVLACHDGAVAHLCWLQRPGLKEQNLRLLSCTQTEDRSIVLWQPQNYCDVQHCSQTRSELAADEDDGDGGVWVEGARLGEVGGNREGFFSAVFNGDGSAVYAHSYKGGMHEWRAEGQGQWVPRPTVSGHSRAVVDCSWEPLGRYLLTCSLDQTTRLHAQTLEGSWHELCRPQVHGYDMSCVACMSSLNFVAGAEEKVLRAFAGPTQLIHTLSKICDWGLSPELEHRDFIDAASVPSLGLSNKSSIEQNLRQLDQEFPEVRPTEDTLMAGTLWPEVAKLYGHGHELMAVTASAYHIASSCRAAVPQDAAIIIWSAAIIIWFVYRHHHMVRLPPSSCGSSAAIMWMMCLRHFSNTLTWILLYNRMQLLVLETTQTSSTLFIFKALITTPEFPEPPSYCPIPCGLFSPCSVDIGRSFGGVVPKFEFVQRKSAVTYQQLQELHHHRLTVTQLTFSSDGSKLLAVSRDRGWSVYQCQPCHDGQFVLLSHSGLLDKAAQHSRIIWAAAWAPGDSAFITASRDKTVAVWAPEEIRSQEETTAALQVWSRSTTLKEEDEVTAVAVTAADCNEWLIATGLVSGTVHVHRYSTDDGVLTTTRLTPEHHSTVRRLAFRPRQKPVLLASCGDDNIVCLYDCTAL
ncbi:WD40 repeat [Trinorchestia longiramus]|nr:WD40 repeat [Trinorchestia longiramus]